MGKLINQLLREKYLVIFYAYRKNGQTIIGKTTTPISFFTRPSLKPEFLIADENDLNFVKAYAADCWRYESVTYIEEQKLSIKRDAKKRQFIFQLVDACDIVMCNNVDGFIKNVNEWKNQHPEINIYYRGQAAMYDWLPSLYRKKAWVENESRMNDFVYSTMVDEFRDCHTTIEKLIKLKHFNQPSRLLDIVGNPLMALYFACASAAEYETDALVGLIYSMSASEKYSNSSDTAIELSAISNNDRIAGFGQKTCSNRDSTNNHKECYSWKLNKFFENSFDEHGERCANCSVYSFLKEQSHQCKKASGIESYWNDISLKRLDQCIIVHPVLNNIRIIHQQGLFILCGFNSEDKYVPPESYFQFFFYNKKRKFFMIDKNNISHVLEELDRLGINKSQVYFDLEKTIDYQKNKI